VPGIPSSYLLEYPVRIRASILAGYLETRALPTAEP